MYNQPEQESIDIRKLQRVLSGNFIEPATLVACSPPIVPRSQVQIPATPTKISKHDTQLSEDRHHGAEDSHDHTGEFRFFHNSVSYLHQGDDCGDTQVDPADMHIIPLDIDVARDSQLADTQPTYSQPALSGGGMDEEDSLKIRDRAPIPPFPEAERFAPSTQASSTPDKSRPEGHNPFAKFGMGAGTGDFSLTQAFNAASSPLRSSPARPPGSSAPLPMTPTFPARIMAKSMQGTFEASPTALKSPTVSKCTSEPPELHGSRSKSLEVVDIRSTPARKTSQGAKHTPRARSLSPVFSSPPVQAKPVRRHRPVVPLESEDDDCFALTKSQERREKADQKRKQGVQQLRKFVRKPSSEADLRGKVMKSPRKLHKDRERRKSISKNFEFAQSEKKRLKTTPLKGVPMETEEERIPLSPPAPPQPRKTPAREAPVREATPQVLASSPILSPQKLPSPAPVPKEIPKQAEIDEEWERVHSFPRPPMLKRRAKSISYLRNEVQHEPELTKAKTAPVEVVRSPKRGSSAMPASLKDMAPFNIPLSPPMTTARKTSGQISPQKKMPDFVRESSGLIPMSQRQSLTPQATSSASASPIQKTTPENDTRGSDVPKTPFPAQRLTTLGMRNGNTTIPETSPWDKEGMLSPMTEAPPVVGLKDIPETDEATPIRKRKRNPDEHVELDMRPVTGAQTAPPLRRFASLEDATPVLSSREEPEDVDMIDILRTVGAGDQPDLELPEPAKPRPTKRRKQSVVETPTEAMVDKDNGSNGTESPALPVLPPSEPAPPQGKALAKRVRGKLGTVANTVASAGKSLARKATKSTAKKPQGRPSLSRVTKPETTQETPTPAIQKPEENISSDILSTTNPVFHISIPKVSDPSKRVFALFKDAKLQYHPATVMYSESPTTLRVCFDDGTEDVLERHQVRSLDLRPGDVIRVDLPNMRKGNWVIKAFQDAPKRNSSDTEPITPVYESYTAKLTDTEGRYYVYVEPKKRGQDGISSVQVSVTKIYLTKALWAQFAPRDTYSSSLQVPLSAVSFNAASPTFSTPAVTPGGLTPRVTPGFTPSLARRTQTPSFFPAKPTPVARNSLFAGMVFCLSFGDNETAKRAVIDRLKANGGRILDTGFDPLFTTLSSGSSTTASPSRSPTPAETAALALTPAAHALGFAAVIADRHSRRTKFLQALALGIPCLAARWVEDCVRRSRVVDWRPYLLPAGESAYLGGAVHSRVLEPSFPADAAVARLADILEARKRPMAGWKVVFIAKVATEKRKAFTFLAHALGAESVTKVKTLDAANKLLATAADGAVDLVLTPGVDRDRAGKLWRARIGRGMRVMDEEQLVQSLILGSLVEDL
ncbi:hypothetical protein EDC01DRAFT_694458 [Geopyxis carbonaria]|nr:hypothetical protein EDC01DRAFT_694458 [Geopyxis carbonaria]